MHIPSIPLRRAQSVLMTVIQVAQSPSTPQASSSFQAECPNYLASRLSLPKTDWIKGNQRNSQWQKKTVQGDFQLLVKETSCKEGETVTDANFSVI